MPVTHNHPITEVVGLAERLSVVGLLGDPDLDTVALQAALDGGGEIVLPAGKFNFTGLTYTGRKLRMRGAGKGLTTLAYVGGAGVAIAFGSASPGASDQLALEDFTLTGNANGTIGIDLQVFNGCQAKNVRVTGFSAGTALRLNGTNCGEFFGCDFNNSNIGVQFALNGGTYAPNNNKFFGGQVTGNVRAVDGPSGAGIEGGGFYGTNIASTTATPAVKILTALHFGFNGCFFENNKGGAASATIQFGSATVADNCQSCFVTHCGFYENNSPTYGVQIYRGNNNDVSFNHQASAFGTAFVRAETNCAQTLGIGNFNPGGATPMLSDASATVDQMFFGQVGQDFTRNAFGVAFAVDLAGTAARALSARSAQAGTNCLDFRDNGGAVKASVDDTGKFTGTYGLEGTFTPSITFNGASTGITYSVQAGSYRRDGNWVEVSLYIVLTNKGSSAGLVKIQGLPFSCRNNNDSSPAIAIVPINITYTGMVVGFVNQNANDITLFYVTEAGTLTNLVDTNFVNNSQLVVSVKYRIA